MPESSEHIALWLRVLDDLTYYELFGVHPKASSDEIREAFHAFCDIFHPDRHPGRDANERGALSAIFKRGTEAILVLSDPALRRHYDDELRMKPAARPPRLSRPPRSRPPSLQTPLPKRLEDAARSPSARPFARRAEELMRAGDLRQAKLQLVMANHLEPSNEELEAALSEVEAKLSPQRAPEGS